MECARRVLRVVVIDGDHAAWVRIRTNRLGWLAHRDVVVDGGPGVFAAEMRSMRDLEGMARD